MAATFATSLLASQLLLLLCTASTASVTLPAVDDDAAPPAAPETVVGGGGGLTPRLPFPGGLPHLPFPFPGGAGGLPLLPFPFPGGNPAAVVDCLNAVHDAEKCVAHVLWSLVSSSTGGEVAGAGGKAKAKACCGALQAVGDRCFRGVLVHASPLRALFAPLVRHACGGGGGLPGTGPHA